MSAGAVSPDERPVIQPLSTDAEAWACAELMASSDPWRRLGRTLEESYRIVRDPAREVYVALEPSAAGDPRVAGFIVVIMQGAFVGYIQSVAVREDCRGRGLGSASDEYWVTRLTSSSAHRRSTPPPGGSTNDSATQSLVS